MMAELLSALVIAAAVAAIAWRMEVRLILLAASFLLAALNGDPASVLKTFFATLTAAQFVVPICTSMGFAHVLKSTGCDRHLVRLLSEPLKRVKRLLVPGAVAVGFLVNIPIISQTSTALAVGTVLVPLLLQAGISPLVVGAALLLGSSVGGELLNPGAPELNTVANELKIPSSACVGAILPLLSISAAAATLSFWLFSLKGSSAEPEHDAPITPDPKDEPLSLLKAAVPLVPLLLLFLTAPPLNLIAVPQDWLVGDGEAKLFSARLIGLAMLVGTLCAAATRRRALGGTAVSFFEGAGYAFTHIISLIVAAQCFGDAVKQTGLAAGVGRWAAHHPALLLPLATLVPLGFAALSGSGMASTQSLYQFFVGPAKALGLDPIQVGALVSIGAAAGRTMSPVSAVNMMCGKLTESRPLDLSRKVAGPLFIGMAVMILAAWLWLLQPTAK